MRPTMQLTLDGLLAALRGKVHDLAEAAEQRYAAAGTKAPREKPKRREPPRRRWGERHDDRADV